MLFLRLYCIFYTRQAARFLVEQTSGVAKISLLKIMSGAPVIAKESKVADVVAYVGKELDKYEFVDEMKNFIHEQAIDGESFLALTEEKLENAGMKALGKREKIISLVKKVLGADERPLKKIDVKRVSYRQYGFDGILGKRVIFVAKDSSTMRLICSIVIDFC